MNIASKCEPLTVSIFRNAFLTDFSRKITLNSNDRESVDFQKNALISRCSKNAQNFHGLWQDISCIEFLVVGDFAALFK